MRYFMEQGRSAQIGCEVNKRYFPTEFSYKMTRNLPVWIGGKKERKKRNSTVREEKKGHGAGEGLDWFSNPAWEAQSTPCSPERSRLLWPEPGSGASHFPLFVPLRGAVEPSGAVHLRAVSHKAQGFGCTNPARSYFISGDIHDDLHQVPSDGAVVPHGALTCGLCRHAGLALRPSQLCHVAGRCEGAH